MRLLRFLLPFLLATPCLAQGTFTAASCSRADVNAVINGPTHTAVNGDKIIIPTTGSPCTWTTGITINGIGIDITGTGTSNTGGGTVGAGTPNTTLIDNAGTAFFNFTGLTVGQTAKVELLTMSAAGAGTNTISGAMFFNGICTVSGCPNIRVDNINFSAGTWGNPISGGLIVIGNVFGVVDHNTVNESPSATGPLVQVSHASWQGVGSWGDNSFASADTFGTAQAIYIESNAIGGLQGTQNDVNLSGDTIGGARYVCRFNTFTNFEGAGLCSNHGTAWGGRPRGARQVEVYYNTASKTPGFSFDAANGLNSGTGYYFSNAYTTSVGNGGNKFVLLDIARFDLTTTPWNHCDGTQPWDQVPFTSSSACIDQPGSGAGLLFTNQNPPTMNSAPGVACTTAGQCWPNPALDPVYEAGETNATGNIPGIQVSGNGSSTRVLANRDYYGQVSQTVNSGCPGACTPFTGASGTGYGPLAQRPTSCTPFVGYWATNVGTWNTFDTRQGTLFVCTSTNTWTSKYTPFTWPHPLTTGNSTLAPPTNLHVTPIIQSELLRRLFVSGL